MSAPTNPSTMDVIVHRDALLAGLRGMSSVCRNSTVESLGAVHLSASDGTLRLSATDLYVSMRSTVAAKVRSPGEVVAHPSAGFGKRASSSSILRAAVVALPRGDVRLRVTGEGLRVSAWKHRRAFVLADAPAAMFPMLTWHDGDPQATYSAGALRAELMRVEPFVSRDDMRPHANSILWCGEGMIATDGHRLIVAKALPLAGTSALVPLQMVGVMIKALAGALGDAEVRIGVNSISLRVDGREVKARLVDAAFPPHKQVIPAETPRGVVVSRVSLLASMRAGASLLRRKGDQGARVTIGGGRCSVETKSLKGTVTSSFRAPGATGEAWSFGVNPRYLVDAANAVGGSKVRMADTGEALSTIVVEAPGGGDVLTVTMPYRVS